MIQLCCPTIIPHILHIINYCIEFSTFPDPWKTAKILPLPKINSPLTYKDLRPISILPCLSKILEKVLVAQIQQHLDDQGILPKTQSGFRRGYSCTTSLLNITDDILRAADDNRLSIMVLLDFSKAFDTIHHQLLINILKYVGFDPSSSKLMANYLSNRNQVVSVEQIVSDSLPVLRGVPQGSVLGPLLYSIYTSNLTKCVRHCKCHFYADDTQLLYTFASNEIDNANNLVNEDLSNLVKYSESLALKINPSKCYVILFGRKKIRNKIKPKLAISIDGNALECKDKVRNLGVFLDCDLRFKAQVSNCLRNAFVKLKLIFNNRFFLNTKVKILLCETLVLSQFNFCDALYDPCIDKDDSKRIQRMQNSCLRLIYGIRKYSSISYKLFETKWLTMKSRRILHSNCLFYKIITTKEPQYLYNKIKLRTQHHNVNIRYKDQITIPLHKTALYERSFSYTIANQFNNLPAHIKSASSLTHFKHTLFDYLFEQEWQQPY